MTAQTTAVGELNWLLDNLVGRIEQIRQAVILTRDGLAIATSRGMRRDDAEHLSAVAAGVQSLARGAGQRFDAGEVRQTIIEMESALLLITAAGHGSCLAVLTAGDADVGLVAYEVALLVKRVGKHLAVNARPPGHDSANG
jgi:predicted regulator of Ras-like GTPase activity (Roadblock/LC7/MglB family)